MNAYSKTPKLLNPRQCLFSFNCCHGTLEICTFMYILHILKNVYVNKHICQLYLTCGAMIFDPWLYMALYSFIFETRPQWQLQCVALKCSVNCCCSVAKLCLTLTLKFHGLQHVRLPRPSSSPRVCSNSYPLVGDAIQPSHPLSSPSLSAFNLSQHEGLFL